MEKLQYAALRKRTGTVVGARREYVRKVVIVESVEIYARASAGRFLARTICDRSRAGVSECGDPAMIGKESLSIGGPSWRGEVTTVHLGVGSDIQRFDWEEAISSVGEGCLMAYFDSSRDELGRGVGSWYGLRSAEGCVLVGMVVTVWDGGIAGMRLALVSLPVAPVLLLSDSKAAISAVCTPAACGWARTLDLRAVVDASGDWAHRGVPLRLV